jgi:hypothetical protein
VTDLLAEATAELYDADPDEFTQRRGDLAARAKEAGQPDLARQITALRKPTRSAWVLNHLARAHPEAAARLAELAAGLRAGGDGARIRELTGARSRLIDELAAQAFAAARIAAPSAAMREEVTGTLGAALADPEVAAGLAAGTLVRAVQWAGFGMIPLAPGPAPGPGPGAAKPSEPGKPSKPSEPGKHSKEPARQVPDRAEKIRAAQQAAALATRDADDAARAEQELEDRVRGLETELEQARERLAELRRTAYRAEVRKRKAIEELSRIQQ